MARSSPGTSRRHGRLRVLFTLLTVLAILTALVGGTQLAVPSKASAAGTTLLSQGKSATASSTENAGTPASAAVDGNTTTRWSSAFSDPQWIQVDLGASDTISQVVLQWETAYGKSFQIQTSPDAAVWTSIYSTTTGTGGTQTLNVTGTGRYIRLYGTARGTAWGYSLWEFQVYGTTGDTGGTCGPANAAQGRPATASSTENAMTPASAAFDGDTSTRWSSAFSDPQWVQVDLGSSQPICHVDLTWEAAFASAFQIQTSQDAATWTTVYSTTSGPGGTQSLNVTGTGRYVRMYGTARATPYGYSLWEFQVLTGTGTPPPPNCPWVGSAAPVATRVSQVIAAMNQSQKISLLHGVGGAYVGVVAPIPALCVPGLNLQDGPQGVGDGLGGVTQLPAPVAAAATWDTALENQYGATEGTEFAGKGVSVALGPTVNIVRDPRFGRAFETFSEDPYLAGQIAAANIQGIQSQGVMAQVKHAAVYNQETNRNSPADNAIVDNQTLQEIYLPAFNAAITKGNASSVMCSYSTINGTYACENPYILNTALYQQDAFTGFVTSDWGATHSTVASANSGLTMEMPGSGYFGTALSSAVTAGTVTTATLNTMVGRVLTKMFEFGLFDKAPSGSTGATVTTPAHVATARTVAEEGTVLLKNANSLLPLSTSTTHSIAVLGNDGGSGVQTSGGGSAGVSSSGTVSPLTGITNRAGSGVTVSYEAGTDAAGVTRAVNLAKASDVAIVFANYGESEGSDISNIDLPGNQNTLISSVAAANPKTIVVLNTGSAVTMPWLGSVAGVFENWYAGQEAGNAIAALLFGDANPSGKLPVTFPASLADVPAHTTAQWPGTNNQVQYSEGVDVGYRWYDSQNKTPLFPFGYGLSYTSFGFSNLSVGALSGNTSTVTATVTNTGTTAGAEVAQLYVGDPSSTGEPPKQLKGFVRVSLAPGQSQTVQFTVSSHDLAHWADSAGGWTTTSGAYQILVGDSSRNLPLTGTITVP
ncbi:Beta-glucosidase [Catenulispora acidiphila DSM 44928]|uniref:Probable beta-glucosidase G n=1 Tax=Catenulispora acidiphila (strain DSM 44928 / JCM 14897 / NBRC 102108 / NRRL B-24433 / ID139908) TaxID=479433 RepID=C7QDF0_CATAD|nr:Beta-glucosidase [Catenulispora acidiphila DSM 44928]